MNLQFKITHKSKYLANLYNPPYKKSLIMDPGFMLNAYDLMFSSDSDDEYDQSVLNKRKKRKFWVRPYYLDRLNTGAFCNIFSQLSVTDPMLFKKYMRMSTSQFEALFLMVRPIIEKKKFIREPICAQTRLAITLR